MLYRFTRSNLWLVSKLQTRNFLSEAHNLTAKWNTRLNSPILQKVNLDNFYYDLEQKFNQNKTISAIDVDIFANKVTDDSHIEELTDLVNKLRKTEEATNILDSTGHALVRVLLQFDEYDQLIEILDNRLEYGVFIDDYTTNFVLDKLLKKEQFKLAARVATIHMLQEDFKNPITRALSLYACLKYLENPEIFDDLKPLPEPEEGEKKKKKKEEIKVRVKFLRNPFFDDHFDIRDSQHLVGKTLIYIGNEVDGSLGFNVKLLGFSLYQKFPQAIDLIENSKGQEVFKSVLEKINSTLEASPDGSEDFKAKLDLIGSTHKIVDFDLEKKAKELCEEAVAQNEKAEIEAQDKIYNAWVDIRQKKLNEELERLQRVERVKKIEKLTQEMKAEEEKLWFFENEEKIDLKIENKRVFYPKRWFGNKKKPRQVDENYIPPDVDKRRNV